LNIKIYKGIILDDNNMTSNNDYIFKKNLETVSKSLIEKNIIYSTQYIYDEDVQIDCHWGPESYWQIVFMCIEKTNDDYIYHLFQSNYLHTYSYPYLDVVIKFKQFSQKLSQIKEIGMVLYDKPNNEIYNYIRMFNDHYSCGLKSTDQDLIKDLKSLSLQIDDIEEILDEAHKKEIALKDKIKNI